MALGLPVVPEVGASKATSSAAAGDRQAGCAGDQLAGQPVVADGEIGPGEIGERGDLTTAQQVHGGHGHAPGLQHGEPGGDEPWVVRPAQQDPVAWDETEILGEHLGGLVRVTKQVAVGPGLRGGAQAGAIRAIVGNGGVQQGFGAVESLRIAQFRKIEAQFRPLILGREVVPAEGIDVGGGRKRHG